MAFDISSQYVTYLYKWIIFNYQLIISSLLYKYEWVLPNMEKKIMELFGIISGKMHN